VVENFPQKQKPKGFLGIAGKFQAKASLSKSSVNVGDSLTLTLEIKGQGLLDAMGALDLSLPTNVKVYPDQPLNNSEVNRDLGPISTRTYKFALVPSQPGKQDLGNYVFSYFDGDKRAYATKTIALGTIDVTGEAMAVSGPSGKQGIAIIGDDIKDIKRRGMSDHALIDMRYHAGLLGLAFLLMLVSMLQKSLGSLGRGNQQKATKKAYLHFMQQLSAWEKANKPPIEALMPLVEQFKTYLGLKFELRGEALTWPEIVSTLKSTPVPGEDLEHLRGFIGDLDSWQYAPQHTSAHKLKDFCALLANIARRLEGK
jgi:hypothetical protein